MTTLLKHPAPLLHTLVALPLRELSEMLIDMTADWKKLARQLDIPYHKQQVIDNANTVGECLVKMIEVWVRGMTTATLEVLIQALQTPSVGYCKLANDLLNDIDIFKQLEVQADDKGETYVTKCT